MRSSETIAGAFIIGLACRLTAAAVVQPVGFECDELRPCKAFKENCSDGFCKCDKGYIRNKHHCFPERKHGESCYFDAQCSIYPMVCVEQEGRKTCSCNKFYEWNSEAWECQPSLNVSAMVSRLEQRWYYDATIEGEARSIFPGIVGAGIMVIVIFAILFAVCSVYGCYWDRWSCRSAVPKWHEPNPSQPNSSV